MQHALAGLGRAPLRELHPDNAPLAPSDAATPDRCVEKSKAICGHGAIVALGPAVRLGESCFPMAGQLFVAARNTRSNSSSSLAAASVTAQKARSPSVQWRRL